MLCVKTLDINEFSHEMGCMNSKRDINDIHRNIFCVLNVDDYGNRHSSGQLEVTDYYLVLYQKGRESVKWPLKCLRRYGFESNLFSFESGRRCKTGPGIYAFKCQRAEQLFNLLQSQIRTHTEPHFNNRALDSRSIDSLSLSGTLEASAIQSNPFLITEESHGPMYMNWNLNHRHTSVPLESPLKFHQAEYANVGDFHVNNNEESKPLNYIVLDLHPLMSDNKDICSKARSSHGNSGGYATIDFDKTVALIKSAHAFCEEDEPGVRKTRHNSTLSSLLPVKGPLPGD